MRLASDQQARLANALRTAAEVYETDASKATAANRPRLALLPSH